MRRSERVVLLLIVCVLLCMAVPPLFFWPGSDAGETKAVLICKNLAYAAEAYLDHPANTDRRLPDRVGDLFRPPWGGPSLYRDGAEEPLDPWDNPFRMEHRRTPDGTDYLLIWTAKPDGTKISQFGVGRMADPG
jgi:general secretion pathway protein G